MFGEFIEAKCGRYKFQGESSFAPDLWMSPVVAEVFTGLILVDDRDQELWLSGCLSGYGGLGHEGTRQILEAEGFSTGHLDVAHNYGQFHIRKDLDEPLHVAERRQ
ncbi:hypothetical protein AMIS_36240 [Actinoplanes missouriensis 431]|uniref:Uncharacterized protein n=2 Tax=Actinoplanes missouriensis TaxID=1866 RepID=I0H757_ACTM4|nr:hypothetical protein AMIS_36240 [Actinoplanes missouriensis 431]